MSRSIQNRPVTAESQAAMRRFFQHMVAPSFGMLGLQSRELIDYVTRLLADFARTDELYRIRDARGRPLETVAGMLLELMRAWNSAAPYRFEREVEVRRHCGDYTLFMSGLFRSHLEAESLLGYYLEQGQQAYGIVAERMEMTMSPQASVFKALAVEFESISGALDYMRKVYMRPGQQAGPYEGMLRPLELN
jgi:hypothetical protein